MQFTKHLHQIQRSKTVKYVTFIDNAFKVTALCRSSGSSWLSHGLKLITDEVLYRKLSNSVDFSPSCSKDKKRGVLGRNIINININIAQTPTRKTEGVLRGHYTKLK